MTVIWDRFEAMLSKHLPAHLSRFPPPATDQQVGRAELHLELEFPSMLRQAYLRHDGCGCPVSAPGGLFAPTGSWASLVELEYAHALRMRGLRDLAGDPRSSALIYPEDESDWADLEVRPVWFDRAWIPIGVSNTASMVYCDLNPAPKGRRGQLLSHTGTDEPLVIAESLDDYLEMLIVGVESGKLAMRDGVWTRLDTGEPIWSWGELRLSGGL